MLTMELLPLFPLNVVLFPASRLRLHIFEERYKLLMERCISNSAEFGVHLSTEDELAAIGCTAKVLKVIQTYQDGSFDIVVEGVHRYKLKDTNVSDENIVMGEVQRIREETELPAGDRIEKVVALYNNLVVVAYKGKVDLLNIDDVLRNRDYLSYTIAEKVGLDLTKRQDLLENLSESQRLEEVIQHMEETIPALEQYEKIQQIVKNDGYLPKAKF